MLDCSTIGAETARQAAELLAPAAASSSSTARSSGGVEGARDAHARHHGRRLDRRPSSARRPILKALGRTVAHFGPDGSGQAAKATNQIMCAGIIEAIAEAMAFAHAQGLPLDKLIDTLGKGAGSSWYFVHRAPNMVRGAYPAGFRVRLHAKDLGSATTWRRASAWSCRWSSACWPSTPSSSRAATAMRTSPRPTASRPSCSSAPTSCVRRRAARA